MKNTINNKKTIDIIQTTKTPLGFFTLVVLLVEVILGLAASMMHGAERTYLIIGMVCLIFLLVFIVAGLAFFRPEALVGKRPVDNQEFSQLTSAERISKYRELIELETRNNLLSNFNIPTGFKAEISTLNNLPFGFCYPENWIFNRFSENIQYGMVADVASYKLKGFARNMNIIIGDVSNWNKADDDLYAMGLDHNLKVTPNATLILKETNFIFQGYCAWRYRIDWKPQSEKRENITLYQILVINNKRKHYTISFTSLTEEFEESRPIFDNIASTFRI